MISSGVESLGGIFSSGPSWATAGRPTSEQAANMRHKKVLQNNRFIILVYRNTTRMVRTPALQRLRVYARRHKAETSLQNRPTAATLPPAPLRSARSEGRVLQFCRSLGCPISTGVAVDEKRLWLRWRPPPLIRAD